MRGSLGPPKHLPGRSSRIRCCTGDTTACPVRLPHSPARRPAARDASPLRDVSPASFVQDRSLRDVAHAHVSAGVHDRVAARHAATTTTAAITLVASSTTYSDRGSSRSIPGLYDLRDPFGRGRRAKRLARASVQHRFSQLLPYRGSGCAYRAPGEPIQTQFPTCPLHVPAFLPRPSIMAGTRFAVAAFVALACTGNAQSICDVETQCAYLRARAVE